MTLVVMLDGLRSDVLENGCMPNLMKLAEGKWQSGYNGAYTLSAKTIDDALASSAPNHAAIALGVTTAKNNITNNGYYGYCDYKKYPSWLVRIAEARPGAKSLFMYSWKADEKLCPSPKVEFVYGGHTAKRVRQPGRGDIGKDVANGNELARRYATDQAPDATLLFLDIPDHAGHGVIEGEGTGFYPYSSGYLYASYICDGIIGRCMDTIAARPTFANEDWLIMVTADHGGYAKTHGLFGGHATAIPLVVAGRKVVNGRIPGTARDYDIAPTVLDHFGIDFSTFDLDGKIVGRDSVTDAPRPLPEGLAVYMTFDEKAPKNEIASGPKGVIAGSATASCARKGYFEGCLRVAADTNRVGGVRLEGSEKLTFENGADFSMTMWVKMDKAQRGDPLIIGNKDWKSGRNPGIALVAAKCTENVKKPGVVFNCITDQKRQRVDVGTYDVDFGKWVFYAVTRRSDGVLRVFQGATDGRLYSIFEDTSGIKMETGLPFYIGQDGTGRYGATFDGSIDDFAMWTRTLHESDVRRIYEAGRAGVPLSGLLGR